MEALEKAIAATCTPAFSGIAGELFLKAVTAVVTAHCTIFDDDYRWPKDVGKNIIQNAAEESISYDFVIVGAGTAGSLLASRLSHLHPSWIVLLVEAGDDPGLLSEIPPLMYHSQNTEMDWRYETNPDGSSCLGFENNRCYWSKAKTMGGCSSTNAMLYVRGHPKDYDDWMVSGNPGWGYNDLLLYFEKQEMKFNFSKYQYQDNPWYDIFDEAWKEIGYKTFKNYNNLGVIGSTLLKTLIVNGKRLNTAKLYLNESKNLHVMKNTLVKKIIIDKESKHTKGLQVQYKNGDVAHIYAKQEVILSAGSVATPQILMLSGIGPKLALNKMDIESIVDLPVGKNLQDHIYVPLILTVKHSMIFTAEMMIKFILQYMISRTGPLSTLGTFDYTSFFSTKNHTDYPDIQFLYGNYVNNDNLFLETYLNKSRYRNEIKNMILELNKEYSILLICACLLHPKSKGEILLSNEDSSPIIKANYLKNQEDVKTLLGAIEFVKKLEVTDSFTSKGIKLSLLNLPGCSQFSIDTANYWECYIRHMAMTIFHPVGTAKMGTNRELSVVNHELLVHGMQNLRVVDASIMPSIPGGNVMAPTLAIAEKAADIIKKQYTFRNEL